ncbi:hypothetical protein QTP70_030699 [Hemibagrus guttatus]|uniref:Uncharacterized protein n=1 Tax=Hemibagrus guttatus TaxID=175788 RepID=A0AAE0QP90_9TELE|nr:hypothetical protein QTP70_030699 [Hemibagrus guttatus]
MKGPELVDSTSRFRFAESCLGLVGCICISYAVCMPDWLDGKGLWSMGNESSLVDSQTEWHIIQGLGPHSVFAGLSFLMAVSAGILCLLFAFCWTSNTALSYSNTRSLLMAGQALYPTTLLLITLLPTGFFFLLSWAIFTSQHIADIREDLTCLGSSYWLGAVGWALLLAVLPVVFLVEQCVIPDILPELKMKTELWQKGFQVVHIRSLSESYQHNSKHFKPEYKRYMSMP